MTDPGVTVERRFAAPRELVWALLSDTNRSDRALGLAEASYTYQEVEGQRQLVGRARQSGISLQWVERPYQWVEGRYMEGRRDFVRGPAHDGGFRVVVEDDDEGCRARVTAFGEIRGLALRALGPLIRAGLRRRLRAYVETVGELVEGRAPAVEPGADAPPGELARRVLAVSDAALVVGSRSTVDTEELARRRRHLLDAPVDRDVVRKLVEHLAGRPDEEVAQMRPFELASAWSLDRRRVLQTFLHATKAGLVDLNWQINCPVCRVSTQVARSLGDVGRDVHCDSCNISYGVDFGANVEAVFRSNAAIREVHTAVYCAASPAFRPHVLAQLQVEPGEPREEAIDLADGHVHVRTLGRQAGASLDLEHAPATVDVTIDDERVTLRAEGRADGPTVLRMRTKTDPVYLSVERAGWSADAVLGSVVASMPDFVDLFATEAPAAGLELSIGKLTLLFSDLTGSTALYERVGDARAFAIVQEHFSLMEAAVDAHDGALVKTMGDAVMATFTSPRSAVLAALDMVARADAAHGELGIGVKLGIHEGACLAVRANDRLDFFGTTVNVAARLQGQAGPGRLVMLRRAADEPGVRDLVADRPRRTFRANLKGLEGERELVEIDLSAGPAELPTSDK